MPTGLAVLLVSGMYIYVVMAMTIVLPCDESLSEETFSGLLEAWSKAVQTFLELLGMGTLRSKQTSLKVMKFLAKGAGISESGRSKEDARLPQLRTHHLGNLLASPVARVSRKEFGLVRIRDQPSFDPAESGVLCGHLLNSVVRKKFRIYVVFCFIFIK